MSLAETVRQLRDYDKNASALFRSQLERVRESRERLPSGSKGMNADVGVDRSRSLDPVLRPVIVRTVAGVDNETN